ncbi:MAG: hypothetical protein ACOX0K_07485 [Oscillospiraceae bacterium]
MLTSEFSKTYETQIGNTVYTITSECPEDTKEDMLDALVRLMKRDIRGRGNGEANNHRRP